MKKIREINSPNPIKSQKWLIVGNSEIASTMVNTLKDLNQKVVAVISRNPEKVKAFAQKHDIPHYYTSFFKIDYNVDYDFVYIALPNALHYDAARFFLEKNKNILVEKIMTHRYDLTEKLFKMADERGLTIMEAYCHFYPGYLEEFKGKGRFMEMNYMQLSRRVKDKTFENSPVFSRALFGGVLPDLGVYPISLAIWLNGLIVKWRIINRRVFNDVEIDVTFELEHENGCIVQSRVSKFEDGDNRVYQDKKIIAESIVLKDNPRRYHNEVEIITEGHYKFSRYISLEVSRIIAEMKEYLGIQKDYEGDSVNVYDGKFEMIKEDDEIVHTR